MTRLATIGFETGHLVSEAGWHSQSSGQETVQAAPAGMSGAYALRHVNPTGASTWAQFQIPGDVSVLDSTTGFIRFKLKFDALPTGNCTIFAILNSAANILYNAIQFDNATDQLKASSGSPGGPTLVTGQVYVVQFKLDVNTAGSTAELIVDGTTIYSGAVTLTSNTTQSFIRFGTGTSDAAAPTWWYDDVAVNNDQGSAENSYPDAAGNILISKPISDNLRDALWTGGAGGTANLFSAVDNIPPIGTATETDLTQIEHAGSAGTADQDYDANMQSYTTIGIGASDVIKVVHPVIVHGEDIATGTKLLACQVLSNPAGSLSGNITVGRDGGALGTFPTTPSTFGGLWYGDHGTGSAVANPSVTLGTSPVMRVRRPETASRVASVCGMYLMVEYTPPAGAPGAALSGTATGTSEASAGAVNVGHPMSGSAVGTSQASAGRLTMPHPLSGVAQGTSEASASRISLAQPLAGSALGTSEASAGAIRVGHPLAGASQGSAQADAGRLSVGHPLAGVAVGSSEASAGRIAVGHPLSGVALGTSEASGNLSAGGLQDELDGVSVGTSFASAGRLTMAQPLSGAAVGSSDASAGRLTMAHPLTGAAVGTSQASGGAIRVGHPLSGVALGTSQASGDLSVQGAGAALSGVAVGTSSASAGRLTMDHPLAGSAQGSSFASAGAIRVAHALAGSAAGVSDAFASYLRIGHALAGTSLGTAFAYGDLGGMVLAALLLIARDEETERTLEALVETILEARPNLPQLKARLEE
jgi:hypothetical protein